MKVREKRRIKKSWTLHCRLFRKGLAKDNGVSERVRIGTKKGTMVAKVARTEVRIHDKGKAKRMAAKDKRKAAKETTELVGSVEKAGHSAAWCRKLSNKQLYAIDEEDSEYAEEANDNEEDLQA